MTMAAADVDSPLAGGTTAGTTDPALMAVT